MNTKEALLALFEKHKGRFFSGEEIAEKLEVSRTAVWKAVESLRAEGYSIDAQKSKGYCLSPDTDIVSSQGVEKYIKKKMRLSIDVYDEVVSTNTLLKELAADGAKEGKVIIANSQTGGKGRLGRSFYSPLDTGLYISVLLRPSDIPAQEALKITTMAAVAACEAIESVLEDTDETDRPLIKWVNDVFLRERKAVGILTEASISMESGNLEYAVLGIGFNVYAPKGGFPKDIKDIAGSILDERIPDAKNKIAAVFLQRFFEIYRADDHENYERIYKEKSLVIGKDVDVISTGSGEKRAAKVLDITSDCNLLVEYKDGTTGVLSSGEVSIRPKSRR
ncbi:MAG: biotin--[acetyl-CoA-carboxylase] ligase [Clostridiales bacterium]|nr:biotin--[acetyl-CoA-carboxylase] ligase [Clostridiales bacterium]MBP5492977.1 biotin--[acetyl-CoA-carboxylase] ligase [Clostridiales bacterium]